MTIENPKPTTPPTRPGNGETPDDGDGGTDAPD